LVNELTLQASKEILHHWIVIGIAYTAHRELDPNLLPSLPKRQTDILTASVKMVNHLSRFACGYGHI
jgi:hypothetical protein